MRFWGADDAARFDDESETSVDLMARDRGMTLLTNPSQDARRNTFPALTKRETLVFRGFSMPNALTQPEPRPSLAYSPISGCAKKEATSSSIKDHCKT